VDSAVKGMSDNFIYSHDSAAGQRELRREYARLTDAADSLASRQAAKEEADVRTRKAREEIKRLAQFLTEDEACSLLSCLITVFGQSTVFGHKESGQYAVERLLDAHAVMEAGDA
jgi:hypothetical protein